MSLAKVDIAPAGRARAAAVVTVIASVVIAVWLAMRQPRSRLADLPSADMAAVHPDFETFWRSAVALTEGAGGALRAAVHPGRTARGGRARRPSRPATVHHDRQQ